MRPRALLTRREVTLVIEAVRTDIIHRRGEASRERQERPRVAEFLSGLADELEAAVAKLQDVEVLP